MLRIQFAMAFTRKRISKWYICRSKREVREVLISDDSQDQFLGVIHSETDLLSCIEAPWTTKLELNSRNIDFKIDTGANVTVISE